MTPLFCRTAGGISLNDKDFGQGRVFFLTIGQLAGQRSHIQNTLAAGQFAGFARRFAGGCRLDDFADDDFGFNRMLVQPFLKLVADNVFDHRTNLGRNQLVFGLRRKLRIRRLNRQNAGQTLAHVFAGNGVFVFFEEVVFGNVVIDGAGQRAAETGQMRTAVFLRNVVGKAEHASL